MKIRKRKGPANGKPPSKLFYNKLFNQRYCISADCKFFVCRNYSNFHFGIRCGDHCLITVSCIIDFVINSDSEVAKVSNDLSADQIGILTNSCGKCNRLK